MLDALMMRVLLSLHGHDLVGRHPGSEVQSMLWPKLPAESLCVDDQVLVNMLRNEATDPIAYILS
jgi:hypothetical protein